MIWSVLKYVVLVVVVSVLLWMAATTVYQTGYDKAQAEGNAALAALGKMYADANADRWAEYAAKEREARERLQDEQEKANALEAALLETKIALADERRGFAKRIADATRNDDCMLSADAVRLYNEALYGPDGTANAGSNHYILREALDGVGHNVSRDIVLAELFWLAEQGLVTLDDLGSMKVATLTGRGQDVALGRAVVPGVKKPVPGE